MILGKGDRVGAAVGSKKKQKKEEEEGFDAPDLASSCDRVPSRMSCAPWMHMHAAAMILWSMSWMFCSVMDSPSFCRQKPQSTYILLSLSDWLSPDVPPALLHMSPGMSW